MPQITRHGKRRCLDRTGITKGNTQRCVKKVYKHGICHADTKGCLRDEMNKAYTRHSNGNNNRFYGDSVYIFHNATLITVYKLPYYIVRDLEKYVEPEAFKKYMDYKNYRKLQCKRK